MNKIYLLYQDCPIKSYSIGTTKLAISSVSGI